VLEGARVPDVLARRRILAAIEDAEAELPPFPRRTNRRC
jgi:hypothetical protein